MATHRNEENRMTYDRFQEVCADNNVNIHFDLKENVLSIDCAYGEAMVGSGMHYRDVALTGGPPIGEVYADLADDLKMGTEPCEDHISRKCEYCADNI